MTNGSWRVLWSVDVTQNVTGSSTFQCTGQKPTFQLSYNILPTNHWTSTFSAHLETLERSKSFVYLIILNIHLVNLHVKTDLSNEDYPELVTAFLDGMAIEMKQSTKGLWDEVKWTYSRFGARNGNLNLILQFPLFPGHRSNSAESYLINQFSKLLESQLMTDLKFIVKGREMAAHAAILASASPVMAAMLEPGKFKEGQSKKVEIDDIEPEVFQQLLRYVYTGTAPELEDEAITEPLFLAADKYQMDEIKEHCEESLIRKLKLENAVRYLVMAHLHLAGRLLEGSIQFLVKCRNEIWDRPEWKKLIDSYQELFYLVSRRMVKNT